MLFQSPKGRSGVARLRGRVSITAAAILMIASVIVPASASAAAPKVSATTPQEARHCVVKLAHLEAGETVSRTLDSRCFNTFADAMSFVTKGKTHLGPNATPADLAPDALAGSNTLGIDFSDGNYSGSSFTATGDTPCTGGHNFAINSMPPSWDNVISSNYPSSGCDRARHWENTNHTGALIDCKPTNNCYYIGNAMNDRTSSEEWFDV